ncbi:hypothetical protein [Halalkalirubrum salinum]|uniref:hypothetical protein n=1 Tax=Halalkalirubrum salinum TaxID=2563889 RepID=UPI0010FB693A|nr:hypothetical protein [Halalkalirubrum salinum]
MTFSICASVDGCHGPAIVVFDPDTARTEHDLRVDESDDAVLELERIHDSISVGTLNKSII